MVASEPLGRIHRTVRSIDEAVAGLAIVRVSRHTNGAGEVCAAARPRAMGRHGRTHPLGGGQRHGGIGLGEEEDKLLAAPPPEDVPAPHGATDDDGQIAQGRVTRRMPIAIIEGFEVIEVDKEQRARPPIALGPFQFPIEGRHHGPVVG